MGGMSAILELMCAHDYIDVRVKAARIFVSCTQNNIKVQNFVARLGTVNLASIVDIEKDPASRECMLGAVSANQKAANFTAKVKFIENGGLPQLESWMTKDEEWYGKEHKRKIMNKLLQICYDLTLNDDSIVADGKLVRNFIANSPKLLNRLLGIISEADLKALPDG